MWNKEPGHTPFQSMGQPYFANLCRLGHWGASPSGGRGGSSLLGSHLGPLLNRTQHVVCSLFICLSCLCTGVTYGEYAQGEILRLGFGNLRFGDWASGTKWKSGQGPSSPKFNWSPLGLWKSICIHELNSFKSKLEPLGEISPFRNKNGWVPWWESWRNFHVVIS